MHSEQQEVKGDIAVLYVKFMTSGMNAKVKINTQAIHSYKAFLSTAEIVFSPSTLFSALSQHYLFCILANRKINGNEFPSSTSCQNDDEKRFFLRLLQCTVHSQHYTATTDKVSAITKKEEEETLCVLKCNVVI